MFNIYIHFINHRHLLFQVRFEGGSLGATPENGVISPGAQTPGEVNILVIERPDDENLVPEQDGDELSDLDDAEGEEKKEKKKKKGKKEKKEKKKKDKKKKKKK